MLKNAPGYLFSVPGLALGLVGVLVTTLAVLNANVAGLNFGEHALLGGTLLILVGYQIGMFGVFARVSCDPIKRPTDRLTKFTLDHVSLERGATVGALLTLVGSAIGAFILLRWGATGFAGSPPSTIELDILALLPVVIGLQTVFGSFYLGMLVDMNDS